MADETKTQIEDYDITEEDPDYDPNERTGAKRRPRGEEIAFGLIGLHAAAYDFSLESSSRQLDSEENRSVHDLCRGMAEAVRSMRGKDGRIHDEYGKTSMRILESFAQDLEMLDVRMIDGSPAAFRGDPNVPVSKENPMTIFGHEVHHSFDAFSVTNELDYYLDPDHMAYAHVDLVNQKSIEAQGKRLLFVPYTTELTQDAADELAQAASADPQASHTAFCDSTYKYHMQNVAKEAAHAGKEGPGPGHAVAMFLKTYEGALQTKLACEKFFESAKTISAASAMEGRLHEHPDLEGYWEDAATLIGNDRTVLDIGHLADMSLDAMKTAAGVAGSKDGENITVFGMEVSTEDFGRDALLAMQQFTKAAQDKSLERNMEALREAAREEEVKARLAKAKEKDTVQQASSKDRQVGE